jgi:hypothetical protein
MRFMKSDEGGVRSGDEPQVRKEAGFGDSASELYHAELHDLSPLLHPAIAMGHFIEHRQTLAVLSQSSFDAQTPISNVPDSMSPLI